jgi:hypothetical protein
MPSCRTIIITTGRVTLGFISTGMDSLDPAPATRISNIMARVALE